MKNKIILGLIILLGFALRSYNLDFPSIGYHNMKENEYLSMAQEMNRTKDYLTRRIYFYHSFEDNPIMRLYPQPPMVSYQTLIAWNILGENIWGARLFNVLFGLASIIIIYLIAKIFFDNVLAALACSLLLAGMPLAVFFSRNLQPESPGFFFLILGSLFYLGFLKDFRKTPLLLAGIAFSLAWLYKFSFLIGILPFLFCIPYKNVLKNRGRLVKYLVIISISYLPLLLSILWLKYIGQWEFEQLMRIKLFEIFTPLYWQKYGRMIWWYVRGENFTMLFTALTLLGILVSFAKRKTLLDRYIIGWTLTIIPYSMVFSDYINQHNYYQMPLLILVCLSSIYSLVFISGLIKRIVKKELFIFIFALAVALAARPVYSAISRMYGTVFLGGDVAGESLKEFTSPGERVFIFTHVQGFGISRYAQRYMDWPINLDDFKEKEKKFGIRYICVYPAERSAAIEPNILSYIRENYRLKEAGLTEQPNNVVYFILEKGKGPQEKDFLQSFSGKTQPRTIYKLMGRYIFFYTIRP
ncbi:MAG: glycosyltransferase family 39 protein [Candidatus Omnitrophica bacterium]|nr:glycosyltransferase family 39 protein [Candidatus Omnitrophota bacterium]